MEFASSTNGERHKILDPTTPVAQKRVKLSRTPSSGFSFSGRGWAALKDDVENVSGRWTDRKRAESNASVDATCVIKESSPFKERWDVLVVLW